MPNILAAIALLLGGGIAALASSRWRHLGSTVGAAGAVAGAIMGLIPTIRCLLGAGSLVIRARWAVPGGSFALGVDPLSAFFLAPLFVLSALSAIYGREYLLANRDTPVGGATFLSNVMVASMVLVVTARNAVLFLMAWEVMTLSSYMLVVSDHEQLEVRRAGWVYLIATHVGVACLIVMFLLLGRRTGSLDFDGLRALSGPAGSGLIFLLAAVGFGVKAGFVPFHVWLPEAHSVAPSHVSALMSGILVKLGIYGFLRILTTLAPRDWWGPTMMTWGLLGGLLGIVLALYQRDLKRALAYSSIENVGIILLAQLPQFGATILVLMRG